MVKDYYKILNITEFSTSDEIKSAYRHLARIWHPDIAGSSPEVLLKFKEINEAYEILSNSTKKADYDTARKFYNYTSDKNTEKKEKSDYKNASKPDFKETTKTSRNGGFKFNWEEFLSGKHAENGYKEVKEPKKGDDVVSDIEISILEASIGTVKVINMLQTSVCPKCGGRKFVNGTQCPHCQGKGETSVYKRFNVKIPAGVKNGAKIRLAGEGEKGLFGGRNGDLYLTIHIRQCEDYAIQGLNIFKSVNIAPYEAVLGEEISLMTPKGSVLLKISPNTASGQKIRLKGCGIEQNGQTGDMIVTVQIQIPSKHTAEEIELYKKLKEISSERVRN